MFVLGTVDTSHNGLYTSHCLSFQLQLDSGGVYAAISCSDKTINLLDFESGECEAAIHGHSGLHFVNGPSFWSLIYTQRTIISLHILTLLNDLFALYF